MNEQNAGHFNVDQFPVLLPPPEINGEELPAKEHDEALAGKGAVLPSQNIGEVVAFCTLALLGGGLLFLVALTDMLWVYPATFYGALIYVAWVRYFSH